MSTVEPPASATPPPSADGTPPPAEAESGRKHSPWLWVAIVLGIGCLGLLGWGAAKSADLSDAQNANAQSNATATQAYQDVNQTLGAQSEQLDQANSDVAQAEAKASKAQQDAAAAKEQASTASDQTAKAQADAKQTQADAAAAQSQVEVVTSCAKAYASAIGSLFEGSDIKAQAQKVKEQLSSITADCRAALGGG